MSLPIVLTIAGSDNSAGAGAQADLKTISALGAYGLTAITCVVAEVPGKVSMIQAMTPEIVAEQIRLSFAAFPVAAVKTGMLYSREIIAAVASVLQAEEQRSGMAVPLVVDPVMVASSGDALLRDDAIALYRERIFPLATVITPNLDEARVLLRRKLETVDAMREAGLELSRTYGCAFLMKGGHLPGAEAIDLLVAGGSVAEFRASFIPGISTHGTGCTYSAAIATGLAQGLELRAAAARAKQFVTSVIRRHLRWHTSTHPTDALHHHFPQAL
jgi:hydroxymethylpyrimidine/phosphomethylpyrimidine kinase